MCGALEAGFQFGLQAIELVGRKVAVARGVDESARGTRGVVEQRLIPARGSPFNKQRQELIESICYLKKILFPPFACTPVVPLIPNTY